jgi:hypothetical protein
MVFHTDPQVHTDPQRAVKLADRIPGTSAARYMGRDVHKEWVGPLPTDPLELCLEYKLGFDDVSDLEEKKCVVTFDERKKLTAEDAKVFAQALIDQGPTNIEYLFLAGNEFGDEGLAAIAHAMEEGALPKLLTVDFSRDKATDAGFICIVNAIKHCRQFRDLIFAENTLGDTGFAALHQVMLRDEWPNIERLNLAGTQFLRHTISDASFVPFATDLADGKVKALRLEELEMSDNDIRDAGYAAFAVAIQRGNLRKLRSLYFVANLITDEGAGALAAAIANNKRTKVCHLAPSPKRLLPRIAIIAPSPKRLLPRIHRRTLKATLFPLMQHALRHLPLIADRTSLFDVCAAPPLAMGPALSSSSTSGSASNSSTTPWRLASPRRAARRRSRPPEQHSAARCIASSRRWMAT